MTCTFLKLPESVVDMAVALYDSFRKRSGQGQVRGQHRSCLIAAAVFYAQGILNSGVRTKKEVCQESGFMRACNQMEQHVRATPAFADLLIKTSSCYVGIRIEDTIGRIIGTDLYIPQADKTAVRTKAIAVYDRIKDAVELVGVHDKNIHTACVYMACGMSKIKLTEPMSSTVSRLVSIIRNKLVTSDR